MYKSKTKSSYTRIKMYKRKKIKLYTYKNVYKCTKMYKSKTKPNYTRIKMYKRKKNSSYTRIKMYKNVKTFKNIHKNVQKQNQIKLYMYKMYKCKTRHVRRNFGYTTLLNTKAFWCRKKK